MTDAEIIAQVDAWNDEPECPPTVTWTVEICGEAVYFKLSSRRCNAVVCVLRSALIASPCVQAVKVAIAAGAVEIHNAQDSRDKSSFSRN
jgi:hypothetical protein